MNNINQSIPKTDTSLDILEKDEGDSSYVENMKNVYKIAFEMFDKDRSNSIDHNEFKDLMRSLGYDLSDNEIEDLMYEGHKREKMKNEQNHQNVQVNTDVITLSQFLTVMNTWRKERDVAEDYMEAFRVFDFTGSGKVEVETIKTILVQYGEDVTEDDISYMLNDADVDGDGLIDYKNFVRLLLNK